MAQWETGERFHMTAESLLCSDVNLVWHRGLVCLISDSVACRQEEES